MEDAPRAPTGGTRGSGRRGMLYGHGVTGGGQAWKTHPVPRREGQEAAAGGGMLYGHGVTGGGRAWKIHPVPRREGQEGGGRRGMLYGHGGIGDGRSGRCTPCPDGRDKRQRQAGGCRTGTGVLEVAGLEDAPRAPTGGTRGSGRQGMLNGHGVTGGGQIWKTHPVPRREGQEAAAGGGCCTGTGLLEVVRHGRRTPCPDGREKRRRQAGDAERARGYWRSPGMGDSPRAPTGGTRGSGRQVWKTHSVPRREGQEAAAGEGMLYGHGGTGGGRAWEIHPVPRREGQEAAASGGMLNGHGVTGGGQAWKIQPRAPTLRTGLNPICRAGGQTTAPGQPESRRRCPGQTPPPG